MLSFSSSGINSIDARIWSRLLPKTTQQLFYSFSGFPRLTDFTYYGMNKYFLLATRPELFNTYHNFLLPRVASNAGKKKIPFRTKKKLELVLSSSTLRKHNPPCVAVCVFLLSYPTLHTKPLWTRLQQEKGGICRSLIIRTRLISTTDQLE